MNLTLREKVALAIAGTVLDTFAAAERRFAAVEKRLDEAVWLATQTAMWAGFGYLDASRRLRRARERGRS